MTMPNRIRAAPAVQAPEHAREDLRRLLIVFDCGQRRPRFDAFQQQGACFLIRIQHADRAAPGELRQRAPFADQFLLRKPDLQDGGRTVAPLGPHDQIP